MSTPGELLINAFNQGVSTGQNFGNLRRQNMLRQILAQNYTAPVAPMQAPQGIPAYLTPNYDPVGKPGGFNMQGAIGQMMQQGFGPEALQMQQGQDASELKKLYTQAQIANLNKIKMGAPVPAVINGKPGFIRPGDNGNTYDLTGNVLSGDIQPRPQQALVNINNKQESAESATVGAGFGKDYLDILKAGRAAQGRINQITRLNQLLDGVDTGKLSPLKTDIASYAQSVGLNVDKNLGNLQAAQALANQFALELRNPSGGAGMPGAMSDRDLSILQSMTPGIEKTPQGRKLIMESMMKLAQRDQEVSQLASKYRLKHGHLDDGFYVELKQWADAHPLFQNQNAQMPQSQAPQAAIDFLKQNNSPEVRQQFQAKYGFLPF